MILLIMRPALLMTLLLTLSVVLIRAQPQDDSALNVLLTPPDSCVALCLLGIRPGETTVSEALAQLRTHDWVGSAQLTAPGAGYGDIKFQWSGQQPDLIDDTYPGRATFYWDSNEEYGRSLSDSLIETLSIYTHLQMYRLQNRFGLPNNGTAAFRRDESLGYSAAYNYSYGMIDLSTAMPCPANLLTYWHAPAKITLSIWRGSSDFVTPVNAIKMC